MKDRSKKHDKHSKDEKHSHEKKIRSHKEVSKKDLDKIHGGIFGNKGSEWIVSN